MTNPAGAGLVFKFRFLRSYSDMESTAASANDTNAFTSNTVTQTPRQNKKITTERTSTFMVIPYS